MSFLRHLFHQIHALYLIRKHAPEKTAMDDRDVLERIIIPYVLGYHNPKKILDIGREDYEQFYNEFYFGRELWTIDVDPKRKEFGAKNHIADNVINLKNHFQNEYFDFILMNGVFGWGLDDKKDVEQAFGAVFDILKPGGLFILGWNDFPDTDLVPLENIQALKKFIKYFFKPLQGYMHKARTGEHTYNFFIKPASTRLPACR